MLFRKSTSQKKQIRCWSAWLCGILVLVLLYFPFSSGVAAAQQGNSEVIPLLVFWGLGALGVLAAFRWESYGGAAISLSALAAGIYMLTKFRGQELHFGLIFTLLLLMTGITFLQCWQRKKLLEKP